MKKNTLWLLVLLSLMGGYAYAQDFSEAAKIRYLIGSVEALQGVTYPLRQGFLQLPVAPRYRGDA